MKRWSLSGTWVVGGTRPLEAAVPFARARVVLRRHALGAGANDEYLLVYGYPSPNEAEGNTMTLIEWEALLSGGGAHQLETPVPAKYEGTLWLLGPRFSESDAERDQVAEKLRERKALIGSWNDPTSDVLVCYIDESSTRDIRDRLAQSRSENAWLKTLEDRSDDAVSEGELAVAIGGMTPERVALLALLYDRQGRESRSKGYLRMALDSRGRDFYDETIKKFKKFSEEVEELGAVAAKVSDIGPRLAKKEVNQSLQFIQRVSRGDPQAASSRQAYEQALDHAERAFEHGGDSPEHFALLAVVHECLGNKRMSWNYLKMAKIRGDDEFYRETLKKYQDFSTLRESVTPTAPQAREIVFFLTAVALVVLLGVWVLIRWTIPAYSSIWNLVAYPDPYKLIATILVYFMQFGFIAFEAGYVRQNYRRASALKNMIVFGMSFLSYMFYGWIVQRWVNQGHPSTLLDICFNAGFASTVALIIANTITERGTLFVNALFSILAAALAYPVLAGAIFANGPLSTYTKFGFIDTAGGCVVHVLGGAIGFFAAWWIGPRMKRRAWGALGRVQIAEKRDILPFSVIGGFFLWFGWLGFNSGNAENGQEFMTAIVNTNIAASAGGLVGLIIAVSNAARLARTASYDLVSRGWWRDSLRDTANLERVILGMMGGLVAVTANASHVAPWQALIEATIGAAVTIVMSAVLIHVWERLDDPLGAIATHGLAGTVGVLCTAFFYNPSNKRWFEQLGIQAAGVGLTIVLAAVLASALCAILWAVERGRKSSSLWLYGKIYRLTAYEQFNDNTGTEYWSRDEAIGRALARVRALPPMLQEEIDSEWMGAVGVLALSDEPDDKLHELFDAINTLLETSKQGRPEEQVAIAAIRARVRVHDLLMLVTRAWEHRNPASSHDARQWKDLDPKEYKSHQKYRKTLILTITDLAESFAAGYRSRKFAESPIDLEDMILGFGKGCELLEQIGNDREGDRKLIKRARRNFLYLKRLPWYSQIIDTYKRISALPREDIVLKDSAREAARTVR